MTFKLAPNPTFWSVVEISIPGGDCQAVELLFKHKTVKATLEFIERAYKADADRKALVSEVVADWRGIDIPFSVDALGQLLENYASAFSEIVTAYPAALRGDKRKN